MRTLKATEMKKYRPVPSRPGSLQPVHLDRGRIVRLVRDYCPYMEWLALIQSLEPEQVWNTTVRPIKQGYDSRPPPPVLYEWFVAKETRYLSACMEALTFDGTRYYRRARDLLGYLTILEITDALVLQEVHLLSQLLSLTPCLEHFRAARARLYITDLRQKNWVHEYKTNRERRMIAKEKGRKDLSPAHQASRRNVMEYVQSVRESK
ncbi:hypothetical protein BGZ59_005018, partial [Podila verticillata]